MNALESTLLALGVVVFVVAGLFLLGVLVNPKALDLDGRVVVVTGGSSGIGLACAQVSIVAGLRCWAGRGCKLRQVAALVGQDNNNQLRAKTPACIRPQEAARKGANVVLVARKPAGLAGENWPRAVPLRQRQSDQPPSFQCSSWHCAHALRPPLPPLRPLKPPPLQKRSSL